MGGAHLFTWRSKSTVQRCNGATQPRTMTGASDYRHLNLSASHEEVVLPDDTAPKDESVPLVRSSTYLERFAVSSIGQSVLDCLQLMLMLMPHVRSLTIVCAVCSFIYTFFFCVLTIEIVCCCLLLAGVTLFSHLRSTHGSKSPRWIPPSQNSEFSLSSPGLGKPLVSHYCCS